MCSSNCLQAARSRRTPTRAAALDAMQAIMQDASRRERRRCDSGAGPSRPQRSHSRDSSRPPRPPTELAVPSHPAFRRCTGAGSRDSPVRRAIALAILSYDMSPWLADPDGARPRVSTTKMVQDADSRAARLQEKLYAHVGVRPVFSGGLRCLAAEGATRVPQYTSHAFSRVDTTVMENLRTTVCAMHVTYQRAGTAAWVSRAGEHLKDFPAVIGDAAAWLPAQKEQLSTSAWWELVTVLAPRKNVHVEDVCRDELIPALVDYLKQCMGMLDQLMARGAFRAKRGRQANADTETRDTVVSERTEARGDVLNTGGSTSRHMSRFPGPQDSSQAGGTASPCDYSM